MIEQQEDHECITIKVAKPKPHTDSFSNLDINLLENDDEEQDLKTSKKNIEKEEFNDLSLSTSQKLSSNIVNHKDEERRSKIIQELKNSFGKKRQRKPEADSCCRCLII